MLLPYQFVDHQSKRRVKKRRSCVCARVDGWDLNNKSRTHAIPHRYNYSTLMHTVYCVLLLLLCSCHPPPPPPPASRYNLKVSLQKKQQNTTTTTRKGQSQGLCALCFRTINRILHTWWWRRPVDDAPSGASAAAAAAWVYGRRSTLPLFLSAREFRFPLKFSCLRPKLLHSERQSIRSGGVI